MRYTPSRKQETFDRIVKAASRLFNERGYNGVGVDGIMKAVGLTAGGFYSHFRSKDALLSRALESTLGRFHDVLLAGLEHATPEEWQDQVIRRYLSRQHRDRVAEGCALPTLAADVSRSKSSARQTFETHFTKLIDEAAPNLETKDINREEARDRALALLSMMVGGILLSRAVRSEDLSDRILLATRETALNIARRPATKRRPRRSK